MLKKLEIIKKTIQEKFSIEEPFWIRFLQIWKSYLRIQYTTDTIPVVKKSLKPSEIPLSLDELTELIDFLCKTNSFCSDFINHKLRISKAYTHYINFKEEIFEVCVRSGEFRDFWLVFKYEDIGKSPDDDIWAEVLKK